MITLTVIPEDGVVRFDIQRYSPTSGHARYTVSANEELTRLNQVTTVKEQQTILNTIRQVLQCTELLLPESDGGEK